MVADDECPASVMRGPGERDSAGCTECRINATVARTRELVPVIVEELGFAVAVQVKVVEALGGAVDRRKRAPLPAAVL